MYQFNSALNFCVSIQKKIEKKVLNVVIYMFYSLRYFHISHKFVLIVFYSMRLETPNTQKKQLRMHLTKIKIHKIPDLR